MTENRIFTLCCMITWVVFLRMFWNFISSLPVKRGGSLTFLVGTISNVLVMEIGWTDVGSGGYILVSCAHSNTSSICFVRQWLKYSEWIWRFAAREGKKVKYVFWNTTAEGKKVKSFTSEHFQVSNLINHITLRIKVKKKYSEWIWRFDAREGKKVKSSCKYPDSSKNEQN
jgi:hypothetical protein